MTLFIEKSQFSKYETSSSIIQYSYCINFCEYFSIYSLKNIVFSILSLEISIYQPFLSKYDCSIKMWIDILNNAIVKGREKSTFHYLLQDILNR